MMRLRYFGHDASDPIALADLCGDQLISRCATAMPSERPEDG